MLASLYEKLAMILREAVNVRNDPHIITSLFLIGFVILQCDVAVGADKQNANLYIGFLAELADTNLNSLSTSTNNPAYLTYIRNTFKKVGEKWCSTQPEEACDEIEIPDGLEWTIAFDGRKLGHIKSGDSFSSDSSDMQNTYQIDAKQAIPQIGKRTEIFAGWRGQATYRPLVVVSQPNYMDPDQWKPYDPSTEETKILIPSFRKSIKKVQMCDKNDMEKIISNDYQYKNAEILISKSYRSRKGTRLISLQLDKTLNVCDGVSGPEWNPVWFYMDQKDHVNRLEVLHKNTEAYTALTLLDAGDYDNDGKSEVIFWMESYNEDGYVLFYNDFKNYTLFSWTYH